MAPPVMPDDLPQLFAHPFSSYCCKVLIALWETATPSFRDHFPGGAPNRD